MKNIIFASIITFNPDIARLRQNFDALRSNMGIALALNNAFTLASENKAHWLLTLNQDSVCAENFITAMLTSYQNYHGLLYQNMIACSTVMIKKNRPNKTFSSFIHEDYAMRNKEKYKLINKGFLKDKI